MGYKRSLVPTYDEYNYWELEFYKIKEYYEENNTAYELEEMREELRAVRKQYEDACIQLSDRNSGEFYTKLVEGWKEEKLELQKKIDELEQRLSQ